MNTQIVAAKLQDNGIKPYTDRSGFPLSQAQNNLQGRTNYAEDGSLRAFNGKIHSCAVLDDGLVLGIVESIQSTANPEDGRIYRPVFFDVFGNVVYRPQISEGLKSLKQAQSAFWRTADELNAVDLTIKGIDQKQKALADEANGLNKVQEELRLA